MANISLRSLDDILFSMVQRLVVIVVEGCSFLSPPHILPLCTASLGGQCNACFFRTCQLIHHGFSLPLLLDCVTPDDLRYTRIR